MKIDVKDICDLFDLDLKGDKSKIISKAASINNQGSKVLMWARSAENIEKVEQGALICSTQDYLASNTNESVTYLLTKDSPRLIFSKVVQHYIGKTAISLDNQVEIYKKRSDIEISENCFIGPNVEIGSGTVIYPNVVIHSGSVIGKNCIIKSFCSIGSEGLGYELENDQLIKFPQLGGVIIGENVEIGPNSTVRRAALDNTIVEDGCKIGAFVNIGHNCIIKKNVIMTCQIVTGGGSIIGKNVFMGIGSLVRQKVSIGEGSVVGQGAVIVKDVNPNEIVVGNPGKVIGNKKSN